MSGREVPCGRDRLLIVVAHHETDREAGRPDEAYDQRQGQQGLEDSHSSPPGKSATVQGAVRTPQCRS